MIDPAIAQQSMVIEQQLQEDDGRRKNQPGKYLQADDDQLQRHMWNQNNSSGQADMADVNGIESGNCPYLFMQRVGPAAHFTVSPCTGQGNGCGAQHSCIHHHQQDAVATKWPAKGARASAICARGLKLDGALETVVPDDRHRSGNKHREGRADQRVEARPFEVRVSEPLLGHTVLLEEQLPGCDRSSHNCNNQENKLAIDSAMRKAGNKLS
jgi:hypothetical protein